MVLLKEFNKQVRVAATSSSSSSPSGFGKMTSMKVGEAVSMNYSVHILETGDIKCKYWLVCYFAVNAVNDGSFRDGGCPLTSMHHGSRTFKTDEPVRQMIKYCRRISAVAQAAHRNLHENIELEQNQSLKAEQS
jgi:hypothetical protein